MHQIEELRHDEVQTLQDEIKELRTANELLQQQVELPFNGIKMYEPAVLL